MVKQWFSAAGYLAIFLMPILLFLGALWNMPWLAFAAVVFVFSLLRLVFGAMPTTTPEWSEAVATFLDRLPLAYPAAFIASVLISLKLASNADSTLGAWVGYGLSLWMTGLFATCVVHELVHRRGRIQATLGHVLAGMCGYPMLGVEHLAHHARPGDAGRAEVPLRAESVWAFAARRLARIAGEFVGPHAAVWTRGGAAASVTRLRWAMLAALGMAAAFMVVAGWRGAVLFALLAVGVAFGVQIITYIQHWSLGRDALGAAVSYGRGWEDDCRFQAWITLNISLHDTHHREARLPYYRLQLSRDSPRLPAGYVLLMFAALVPPLWRHAMNPALARWVESPSEPWSAGRRLTCFGLPAA